MTRWRTHHRSLFAVLGGVLFALSTPPTDLYPCVFVGLAFLALAVRRADGFWRGFGLGAVWAASAGLVGMRFVPSVIILFTSLGDALALLAHILLSAAQSLQWALGMGLCASLRKRLNTPLEFAFGAGVFLALVLPSVFLWSPAGLLTPWLMLVQGAEFVGERGLSVAFAIIAALLVRAALAAHTARRLSRTIIASLGLAFGLLGVMLVHGRHALATIEQVPPPRAEVDIALIHAGVDPKFRWVARNRPTILHRLRTQTAAAERAGIDLAVWPEAAYPFLLPHDARWAPRGRRAIVGGGVRGPILFGLITMKQRRRLADGSYAVDRHNSATIVNPQRGLQPSYDKMQLLWFGETVPGGQYLPWLRKIFQRSGGLLPGAKLRALHLKRKNGDALKIGVLNCYEDTLPDLGRRIAKELSPNLLVNVTNDAWFVGTQEPELHLRLSAMRAIELRRDMVRAVNLGVSAWIDASGRVRARYDKPEPGYLKVRPQLRSITTTYVRFGDLPLLVLLLLGISGSAWRQRRLADARP